MGLLPTTEDQALGRAPPALLPAGLPPAATRAAADRPPPPQPRAGTCRRRGQNETVTEPALSGSAPATTPDNTFSGPGCPMTRIV